MPKLGQTDVLLELTGIGKAGRTIQVRFSDDRQLIRIYGSGNAFIAGAKQNQGWNSIGV